MSPIEYPGKEDKKKHFYYLGDCCVVRLSGELDEKNALSERRTKVQYLI